MYEYMDIRVHMSECMYVYMYISMRACVYVGEGKVVPVLNYLSTMPSRHMGE
jgi:hypothetical protein